MTPTILKSEGIIASIPGSVNVTGLNILKLYSYRSTLLTKHKENVKFIQMDKKIYHGGKRIVRTPAFGIGRQYNDFGLGFYCAEYPQYAAEWAVGSGRNGFISAYSIDADFKSTTTIIYIQIHSVKDFLIFYDNLPCVSAWCIV